MDKQFFQVFIEAGHTLKTLGKQSPDWENDGPLAFKETIYCRDLVNRIKEKLEEENIDCIDVTPDINSIDSLGKRVNTVNSTWSKCKRNGKKSALYISIHNNAFGNGTKWMGASGWSIYTTVGKTNSDKAAEIFWNVANSMLTPLNKRVRQDLEDKDHDFEENFYVLKKSNIPAILTENMFQDNKDDVQWLISDEGVDTLVSIHVNGIKEYIKSL
jgi:N-acetylmuramoyl-L-alanine amidase